MDAIRAAAVREFRASKVLQEDKDMYAASFTKYGFYLARGYLEHKRLGKRFLSWFMGRMRLVFLSRTGARLAIPIPPIQKNT